MSKRRILILLIILLAFLGIGLIKSSCVIISADGIVLIAFTLVIVKKIIYRVLNILIKRTNWWQNNLLYTNQFITNEGYRKNLQRNLEIVNLGSNPALFGFFYDNIRGQNWSTGTQGPDMDLAILQLYHSYVKKDGIILIPIVPFSSCTAYLWNYKTWWFSDMEKARFIKVLKDGYLPGTFKDESKLWKLYSSPLSYDWKTIISIFFDSEKDNRFNCLDQTLSLLELQENALQIMNSWKKEFDITNFDLPLDEKMDECHDECADKFAEMVEFCKERDLKPVLILPPVTKELASLFTEQAKETYIYSFIRRIKARSEVYFLDYMEDAELSDSSLYFNSLYLNMRGRKLFTNRVIKDLNLN